MQMGCTFRKSHPAQAEKNNAGSNKKSLNRIPFPLCSTTAGVALIPPEFSYRLLAFANTL